MSLMQKVSSLEKSYRKRLWGMQEPRQSHEKIRESPEKSGNCCLKMNRLRGTSEVRTGDIGATYSKTQKFIFPFG